jgi:hypothetical protein
MVPAGEQQPGRLAQAQRRLGGHRVGVRRASDAVGSKKAPDTRHRLSTVLAKGTCCLRRRSNGSIASIQADIASQTLIA